MVEMMGSDLMRLLATLIAVFMVSGAVAQKKPTIPSYSCTSAGSCTDANFKCQFKSKGPSGPIYACKDPKTGKTQMLKCKNPSKSMMPPKDRPTVMTMAKLKKACGLLDGLEDIDSNG